MIKEPYSRAIARLILHSMQERLPAFEEGDTWKEEWVSTMVTARLIRANGTIVEWDPLLLCPQEEEDSYNQRPDSAGILAGAITLIVNPFGADSPHYHYDNYSIPTLS